MNDTETTDPIEQPPIQDPPQEDPPKGAKLHQSLLSEGYTIKNLGTEEEFVKALSDSATADKIYKGLISDGYTEKNLGAHDEFISAFAPQAGQKKNGQVVKDPVAPVVKPPVEPTPVDPTNPVDIAKQISTLESTHDLNAPPGSMYGDHIDPEAKKKADKLRATLTAQGYDADKLNKDFTGIPDEVFKVPGFSKDELLVKQKENPQNYERSIATATWQPAFHKTVNSLDLPADKKAGIWNAVLTTQNSANEGDYAHQRKNVQNLYKIVNGYSGTNRQEILKNLAIDRAKTYGRVAVTGYDDTIKKDARSEFLDNPQILAMQYLEDTNPDAAAGFSQVLIDPKKLEGNTAAKEAWEEKMSRLSAIGIQLQESYLQENINTLAYLQKHRSLTEAEQAQGQLYTDKLDGLKKESAAISSKYRLPAENAADEATKEIIGTPLTNSAVGAAGWTVGKAGEAIINTGKGVWDMVSEPFRSDEGNKVHQLTAAGELSRENSIYQVPQEKTALQSFELKINTDLKAEIDKIKNDKSLSYNDQYKKVNTLLSENPTEWAKIPLQGGKLNITPTSLFYSVAGIAATLAPYIALETATGGGATAGVGRKILASFTAATATGFHDNYAAAVQEGEANPFGHALRVTALQAAAMAGAGTAEMVKALYSPKTAVGEIIAKMTDKEIQSGIDAALRGASNGLLKWGDKVYDVSKAIAVAAKKGAVTGAKFEGAMMLPKIANNLIDGKPVDMEQNMKEALVGILSFSAIAGATGARGEYRKVTTMQSDGLLTAAKTPELYLEAAAGQLKEGAISKEKYDQIVANITKAGKVAKTTNFIDSKGEPLSWEDAGKLLLVKMKMQEVKDATAGEVPEKFEADMKMKMLELVSEANKITDPDPLSLQEQHDKLAKEFSDRTIKLHKENYRSDEIKTDPALLEMRKRMEDLKEQMNPTKKEAPAADTKLSEPIPGLDAQGVPLKEEPVKGDDLAPYTGEKQQEPQAEKIHNEFGNMGLTQANNPIDNFIDKNNSAKYRFDQYSEQGRKAFDKVEQENKRLEEIKGEGYNTLWDWANNKKSETTPTVKGEATPQPEKKAEPARGLEDVATTAKTFKEILDSDSESADLLEEVYTMGSGRNTVAFKKAAENAFLKEKGLPEKVTIDELNKRGINPETLQKEMNEYVKENEHTILADMYHAAKTEGKRADIVEAIEKIVADHQVTEPEKKAAPGKGKPGKPADQEGQPKASKGKPVKEKAAPAKGQKDKKDKPVKPEPAEPANVHYEDKNGNQVVTGAEGLKTVVNKKGKEVSAPTYRRVMAEHVAQIDFTAGKMSTPSTSENSETDAAHWTHIVETSENPVELLEAYEANHEGEPLTSVEYAIATVGIGKVRKGHADPENEHHNNGGFQQFDDLNNLNESIARTYGLSNKRDSRGKYIAHPLDSIAQEVSDTFGVEVTPEDVAAYMKRFFGGKDPLKERPNEVAQKAAEKFEQITGLTLAHENGVKTPVVDIVKAQAEVKRAEAEEIAVKEASLADAKINSDLAKEIIKDNGLTLENLEANKHLFNEMGFPFSNEDYEHVKKELNEPAGSNTVPESGEQQATGVPENKETGVDGEEKQGDKGLSGGDKISEKDAKVKEFDEAVDDVAQRAKDFLHIKPDDPNVQLKGLSPSQLIDTAAQTLKRLYRAGKDIEEVIKETVQYVKDNWDKRWGVLDEAKLTKIFTDGLNQKIADDQNLKANSRADIAATYKRNAQNKTFMNALKNSGLVKGIHSIAHGTIAAFHPFLLDGKEQARDAAMIIVHNKSKEAHENLVAEKASEDALNFWNKQKRVDNLHFMISMEAPDTFGGIHGDLRAVAEGYRIRMEAVFDMIAQIKDVNFLEDYFPHFWKNPDKAKSTLPNLGKTPLEGNKSFLKKRFYQNLKEGMDAGLDPATYNPEEMVRLAEQNALHFKTANDIFEQIKKADMLKYFQGKPAEGWVKITDPLFSKRALFVDKEGDARSIEGSYYARDAVAAVINNFTAKGLFAKGGVVGTVTKSVRYLNNIKNQVQLGLGLFHFSTTTIDATVTGWANGVKLMSTGKPLLVAKGAFDLAKSISVFPNLATTFLKGYRTNKEYKTGVASANVDNVIEAGGRIQLQKILAIDAAYNMKKSWQNFKAEGMPTDWTETKQAGKDFSKAAWNAIWVLPEKIIGHALMNVWVPALKTGGYLNTLKAEMLANPHMTEREVMKAKQRIWASMDNRLGQVVYDNVFWDKTVKDVGFMGIRSLGWTGGTVKAFGTGAADTFKSIKNIPKGKGIEHTTAWMLSLPVAVGTYGALYQYAMTGKPPETAEDCFFPKDGTINSDGTEHRVSLPSYMKDVWAYMHNPLQTAGHKLSPVFHETNEILSNKDFYGTRVYNPDDKFYKKGLDILKYEGKSMIPFSLRNSSNEPSKGFFETVASKEGVQKVFGVMAAPREFEKSSIQNKITEQAATNYNQEARTQEQTDLYGARHEVKKALRAGVEWEKIPAELRLKAKYDPQAISKLQHDAKLDYYGVQFRELNPEQQLKVWDEMTEDDKKKYGKFVSSEAAFSKLERERDEIFKANPKYKSYLIEMQKLRRHD